MTPSEKKALLFICGLILLSLIIQWFRPHVIRKDVYDYSLEDSLFKVLSADTSQPLPYHATSDKPGMSSKKQGLKEKSININEANKQRLELLPRIGPATAKRIIQFRKEHGPFQKIEDIKKVRGIGPKTFERLKPFIYTAADSI